MSSKRTLLSLLALGLCCGLAPADQPTPLSRTVILVSHSREATWRDIAFLAAVPAACKANEGNAAVIALDDNDGIPREVADYLRRYRASAVWHLGPGPSAVAPGAATAVEIPAASAEAAAVALAARFWTTCRTVVLCRRDDYASGLMASTLAARLRVPLLLAGDEGLSPSTSEAIRRLKAEERIFVGQAPAGIKATRLADFAAVCAWLKSRQFETPYLALVNPRDRAAAAVPKLSLAGPLLAAAHEGMVLPVDRDIRWRVPVSGEPAQGDLPRGIPAGKTAPKLGVIELTEGKVPFAISFGASRDRRQLHLDLNGDGAFDGAGEGPFQQNCWLDLLGKPRHLDFAAKRERKCDLAVTTGRAEEMVGELRKLYATTGIPRYLCLVGFPDSIPQAILPHRDIDLSSDLPYGNADDDLFSEIAVGRVIGESATFATLHASRVVTYPALLDPEWSAKAGQARWENTMAPCFENVGLDASAYHDRQDLAWLEAPTAGNKGKLARSFSQDSPLTRTAFLTHMAHSWWKDIGETYDMDSSVLLAPVVVESGGCLTCNLDHEPRFRSVIARLFRNGAVSFTGQTLPGIAHQEQQRAQFWNMLLSGGTIGEAHRHAQNSMASTVLETGQTEGGPDHYQLHIRSLFGDPAFAPRIPSPPRSAPARVEVKDNLVSVHAPETWWKVKLRVPEDWKAWADKPLYVIRGAGTYPYRYWCGEQYDREEIYANAELTTNRTIKSIRQLQNPPPPLGWTGKHSVDENPDGTRTYRWRVRLIDFDQKTGETVGKLDRIDYRIEFDSGA